MPPAELTGLTILVTRPAHQAAKLCQAITARGGQAIHFPALEIVPNPDDTLNASIDRLSDADIVIFISINAVNLGIPYIRQRGKELSAETAIAAIGQGTAAALRDQGLSPDIVPAAGNNSEALLSTPALQAVEGKKIVIFRGQGGRPVLGDTLSARGADIRYAECYRRLMPQQDPEPLIQALLAGQITLAVFTSGAGLANILALAGKRGQAALLRLPLVVVSPRLAGIAAGLGFCQPALVADSASDDAILHAIETWHASQKTL